MDDNDLTIYQKIKDLKQQYLGKTDALFLLYPLFVIPFFCYKRVSRV